MTEFGRLDEDGTYTKIKSISQESMLKCPHFMMIPEHYRDDESCRCNDPEHVEMQGWGYKWDKSKGRWT